MREMGVPWGGCPVTLGRAFVSSQKYQDRSPMIAMDLNNKGVINLSLKTYKQR